jgi:cytochrome P450
MSNAKTPQRSACALPPGPRGYPLFGVLPQVLRDPLGTLMNAARKYGGVVYLGSYRPGRPVILISHPEPLRRVLHENYRIYERGLGTARLVPFLGYSLVTLEGESWFQRRRLLQPVFHNNYIAGFASTMANKTAAMLGQWQGAATRGETLDISAEVSKLTRDILIKAVFGLDMAIDNSETIALGESLKIAMTYTSFLPFKNPFPLWAPTPRNRAFRQAIETLDRMVYRIIDERRRNLVGQSDMVALLLNARDADTGAGLDDRQLRDEVMTFFFAGSESTATTLAWAWYLLALHPEVERRVHAEVDEVLGGRLPTVDDLPGLVYTRMALMESMRLFPAGWLFSRSLRAGERDEIEGHAITEKALLLYSPYVTHRLPELWENPDAFDPERFTPERVEKRPRFAYIPFGDGPRQCIGNNLSQMETHLILAMVAQRYSLRLATGTRVEPEPIVALCPRNGLPMTLHARSRKRVVGEISRA